MIYAKRPRHLATYALALTLAVFATACDSNDPDPMPPGISGNVLQVEGARGTVVDISINLTAEAGIQSLTLSVDGGAAQTLTVNVGATQQAFTHSFEIPAASVLGTTFSLVFTLTDQDGATSMTTAMVTTGKVIDTPATYEFTRNGQSSVSFGGQNDRLDMVEEMKAVLRDGDRGEIISEQVLLDMFENTGDNGGGNFSFTSDRQLKNKVFAPDLDDRLFEDLFARAAAASVVGNGGGKAANGTAGLIERENSGSTILVDENGREFTQFIEKGLMGSVMYNQVFNLYLTDARTGDDVENVALADGKNYTNMEHGWDEAFGYWNPPLDFTSPWPSERGSEDRFWSHYSNVVDNVNNGQLGTNTILMTAYREGRAAIVNNDLATKNTQRDILYEYLELVAAATAVHYINDTLAALDEGETGEAFHVLSEAWAFTNALRYSPRRTLSLADIEQIMETDFGANGNFWNVTPAGLNAAKATLVNAYPKLAPVQDDL